MMSNEEKILELLAAMDARQTRTEELLAAMQAEIKDIRSEQASMGGKLDDLAKAHEETRESVNTLLDRVDDLTEAHEETREGVNTLLSWAEKASNALSLPPPRSQTRGGFFCSCPTTPRPPTVRCIRPPDANGWQTARQNRSTPG